jgi:hypothetical protein
MGFKGVHQVEGRTFGVGVCIGVRELNDGTKPPHGQVNREAKNADTNTKRLWIK